MITNGWMDGYFINPEGNLGHPVVYTLITYTYTTHINNIHIGRTCSQGVGSQFTDTIMGLTLWYSMQ